MTDATRYPLSWPLGWKRTLPSRRTRAKFSKQGAIYINGNAYRKTGDLTVPQALERVRLELGRLSANTWIISTNVELNSYGDPRGGRRDPDDPGVAVYFKLAGKDRVLACDAFDRVSGNLAAVAAHIDCLRGIDRYGVGTLDQAFAGYDALPPPGASNRPPWRKVLGIAEDENASAEAIQAAYRDLAKTAHPDLQGGSTEAMAMLNAARDEAMAEVET